MKPKTGKMLSMHSQKCNVDSSHKIYTSSYFSFQVDIYNSNYYYIV